jgi:hypothetical protein
VGIFKESSEGNMDIIVKFAHEELELLIEIMERHRLDEDNENKLRNDLKKIRKDSEDKKILRETELKKKPSEEIRLKPNPTSAEHVE